MSILAFEGLTKTLPGGKTLFADLRAAIEAPASVALLAPSGQGKSTLLRLLARLDSPCGGEIRLEGKPASEWHPQAWRRKTAYVAQQAVMLPGTVEHNLRAYSALHGSPFDVEYARALTENADLSAIPWDKPADELSGGEKQRVALIRSLLAEPTVLLLDEATASLDRHCKQAVETLLSERLRKQGTTLVWVTHDLEQARRVSERIWFMDGGGMNESETGVFFDRPPTDAAAEFLRSLSTEVAD